MELNIQEIDLLLKSVKAAEMLMRKQQYFEETMIYSGIYYKLLELRRKISEKSMYEGMPS